MTKPQPTYKAISVPDVHKKFHHWTSWPKDELYYDEDSCAYICPCGTCNAPILLPISTKHDPGTAWGFSVANDLPTLTPSVWSHGQCDSHYFMKDGQIQWCN